MARTLAIEHAPDAALRIGDIPLVARDQVNVNVHARLTRGLSDIDAPYLTH